ncbi:MAG: dephospho-CoA kinase [Planctomycetaceae bacterium]|nr:dephospho-CoA kinase [Planctomycetaceae bacterium]
MMKTLGIIGGIGSGKSTIAEMFRQRGIPIISADTLGHQALLLPNIKDAVRNRWGTSVFDDCLEIDRRKLAAIVFADKKELAYLKSLTHPLIADEVHRQREEHRRAGASFCLLDAPLLLESGWDHFVDLIIFVDAPPEVRWSRVQSRGWTEPEWKQREAAQFSMEEKASRADVVFDNIGDVEHLQQCVDEFMNQCRMELFHNPSGKHG